MSRYQVSIQGDNLREVIEDLELILEALRGRPASVNVQVTRPPDPRVDPVATTMPLADPPTCPDHPQAGYMTFKPGDATKGRQAAYWCQFYGCRQRVPLPG